MEAKNAFPEADKMDESLEQIFLQIIEQGDTLDAVDFVKSLDTNIIPNASVLRTIIFKVLMKSDDIRSLAYSYDYLVTVLTAFPPNTEQKRTYYFDSIRDVRGHLDDMWSVFCHIVDSYFYHHSVYVIANESNIEPIRFPNCKFLLEFYVKLFSIDFEYLYYKSFHPCLMMQLLWPSHNSVCLCSRTDELLKWIDGIYCNYHLINQMAECLKCLHEMLILMVKCFFGAKLSEIAAFKHPCLSEIVEATANFCKNSFDKPEKVKLFLASLSSVKCFQARVSERILRQVLKQGTKRNYALTLKDIVFQYMFPQKFNKFKTVHPSVNKEKNLRKRPEKEKKASVSCDKKSSEKKSEPEIHRLVNEKRFGDLFEALCNDPSSINETDSTGNTPLHVACQIQNYRCAQVLIQASQKDSIPNLDFAAMNVEGYTALHLAVKGDSVDIVRDILSTGDPDLLNIRDNEGYKPSDWCASKEMESLLQTYQPEMSSNDSDTVCESSPNLDMEAPNFKLFIDYSIYLHALTCFISSYYELFNLHELIGKKNEVFKDHASKQCCHYLEEDICSEDAKVIPQMPNLIENLTESLQKNATKRVYNIDIELIPLKLLAAALKTS